eukprot:scaffold121570_cov45-Phaeocystis_antarctica.AAC.1
MRRYCTTGFARGCCGCRKCSRRHCTMRAEACSSWAQAWAWTCCLSSSWAQAWAWTCCLSSSWAQAWAWTCCLSRCPAAAAAAMERAAAAAAEAGAGAGTLSCRTFSRSSGTSRCPR